MFRIIEPEVAGSLGPQTLLDNTVHPPIIQQLHYLFEGWLGDDLLESFPSFLMTDRLRQRIEASMLTGVVFDDVLTTKSLEFNESNPEIVLPKFYWAKIQGAVYLSDFFYARILG